MRDLFIFVAGGLAGTIIYAATFTVRAIGWRNALKYAATGDKRYLSEAAKGLK